MKRESRRRLVRRAEVAFMLGVIVACAIYAGIKGLTWAGAFGSIAAFFVGLIAFIWPFIVNAFSSKNQPSNLTVSEAVELVAERMKSDLAKEERARQINDPYPMPVRWRMVEDPHTCDSRNQKAQGGDHSDESRIGDKSISEIYDAFKSSPSRRMIILGSAGAGKSVLSMKLALGMLEARSAGNQIPLIIPASTWKPGIGLLRWIEMRLARDYPELAGQAKSTRLSLAEGLADSLVVPIIDGLDELPISLRSGAISTINDAGSGIGLVATSRPVEYADAISRTGRPVSRATTIMLLPLESPEVKHYLREATSAIPQGRWDRVFAEIEKDRDGPLHQVLANPLMLWLARTIYGSKDSNPGELLNDAALNNREAMELHLLNAFIPSVYSREREWTRGALSAILTRPSKRWSASKSERWLSFLASYSDTRRSRAVAIGRSPYIAWWEFSDAVGWWSPIIGVMRVMILLTVAWESATWALRYLGEWQNPIHVQMYDIFSYGYLGRLMAPAVERIVDSFWGQFSSGFWGFVGSPLRSLFRLEFLVAYLAIAFLLIRLIDYGTFGHYENTATTQPSMLAIRPRAIVGAAIYWLFLAGGLFLAAQELQPRYFGGPPIFIPVGSPEIATVSTAESFCLLAIFIILWGVVGTKRAFLRSADISHSRTPAEVLRRDRKADMVSLLLVSAVRAMIIWLCVGTVVAISYVFFMLVVVIFQLAAGGSGSRSASVEFARARIWLVITGKLPWRVAGFLEDAHSRGVLRQVGMTYQFRHIRLQRQLSERRDRRGSTFSLRLISGLDAAKAWFARQYSPAESMPSSAGAWSHPRWESIFDSLVINMPAHPAVGTPGSRVKRTGTGVAKFYGGLPDSTESWVICALPYRNPILVTKSIWDALRAIGEDADVDPFLAIGLPTVSQMVTGKRRVIRSNSIEVEVSGGWWGPGIVHRNHVGDEWKWEPRAIVGLSAMWVPRYTSLSPIIGFFLRSSLCIQASSVSSRSILGIEEAMRNFRNLNMEMQGSRLRETMNNVASCRAKNIAVSKWRITRSPISGVCRATCDALGENQVSIMSASVELQPDTGTLNCECRIPKFVGRRGNNSALSGGSAQARLSMIELKALLDATLGTVARLTEELMEDPTESSFSRQVTYNFAVFSQWPRRDLRAGIELPPSRVLGLNGDYRLIRIDSDPIPSRISRDARSRWIADFLELLQHAQ